MKRPAPIPLAPPVNSRLLADIHELRDPNSYADPPPPKKPKAKWRRR